MSRRQQELSDYVGGSLHGYVRCSCGSGRVWVTSRRSTCTHRAQCQECGKDITYHLRTRTRTVHNPGRQATEAA